VERIKRLIARVKALPGLRTVAAVQERYSRDGAGFLASTIAYHAFISVFPLLLVGMSVAGFLLTDPESRMTFSRTLTDTVPGLQPLVGDSIDALVDARGAAGLLGLLGLVWTGTNVVRAAGHALDRVFSIGHEDDSFIKRNAWAMRSLATLGALAAVAMGMSFGGSLLPGDGAAGIAIGIALIAVGLVVDMALFLVAYRILTRRKGPTRGELVRGAMLAAVGWTLLKLGGSAYAQYTVADAQAVYGTFAGALGLLVLLSAGARIFMYGAELNALRIDQERERQGEGHGAEDLRRGRSVA